jgi:hypothetical protein
MEDHCMQMVELELQCRLRPLVALRVIVMSKGLTV